MTSVNVEGNTVEHVSVQTKQGVRQIEGREVIASAGAIGSPNSQWYLEYAVLKSRSDIVSK